MTKATSATEREAEAELLALLELEAESESLHERLDRPCVNVTMIRHGESRNNAVYGEARDLYTTSATTTTTRQFDEPAYKAYVEEHRQADPGLSATGRLQALHLADYLVPRWTGIDTITDAGTLTSSSSSSSPPPQQVSFVVSPMRRACETLQPTLTAFSTAIQNSNNNNNSNSNANNRNNSNNNSNTNNSNNSNTNNTNNNTISPPPPPAVDFDVTIHGMYFESEGCHKNNIPEEGMNPQQISQLLSPDSLSIHDSTTTSPPTPPNDFATHVCGFRDPRRGWWCHGTGPESRADAEQRAATFYLWLCEFLNQKLEETTRTSSTILASSSSRSSTGSSIYTSKTNTKHPKEVVLVGHGDLMSMVLQRIIAGFGHAVETCGVPHRAAFVHANTGITELAYFGHGRFLLLHQNRLPHLLNAPPELQSGGTLKDGWSYLMPTDAMVRRPSRVSIVASEEEWDDHVQEQRQALKALYLCSASSSSTAPIVADSTGMTVNGEFAVIDDTEPGGIQHFVVQRGLQVVGVATFSEKTGRLFDVAVRPSAGTDGTEALFNAVKEHSKKLGRSGSLLVQPKSQESKQIFAAVGFGQVDGESSEQMEFIID